MAATLSVQAVEGSTYVVTAAFTDEDGVAVVPDSVSWTLTDEAGTVVNSREGVSETPASSVEVVLSGDDLTAGEVAIGTLLITFRAVYDSSLALNLPLVGQARLEIVAVEPE